MPITAEQFESKDEGELTSSHSGKGQAILTFLQTNREQAFTKREIATALNKQSAKGKNAGKLLPVQNSTMQKLIKNDKVEQKGDYYKAV